MKFIISFRKIFEYLDSKLNNITNADLNAQL